MDVFVCIGSACHVKGSYGVMEKIKENVKRDNLEENVCVLASFCLGHCEKCGVSIKVDEQIITGVTASNVDEIYKKHVVEAL